LDESLRRWLRADRVEAFPRRITFHQEIVDEDAFEGYVERCLNSKEEAHAAIFSEAQKANKEFDTVLLDLDMQKMVNGKMVSTGDANVALGIVVDRLVSLGFQPRVDFTGRKYHIWLDFVPTRFEDYTRAVKSWAKQVIPEFLVDGWIDYDLLGVEEHMCRLPMSWNAKGNDWAKEIRRGDVNVKLGQDLKVFDDMRPSVKKQMVVDIDLKEEEFPPCIKKMMAKMRKYGDLDSREWFALGSFFVFIGKAVDGDKFFQQYAKSYDKRLATQQMEFLVRKNYLPLSCRSLGDGGYCPYVQEGKSQKECSFWPWMMLKLAKPEGERK
jgi:hypothetical protein